MDRKTIGRYEIVGELGRGAMGSVLRARDPVMGREVAIKCILSAALAADQTHEFRERFYREARAAGALSHPGIVPVFDVGEDNGVPYLVMELVQGRTLDAVLKQGQRFSLDRVCEICQQLAEALGFAHRHGIIHRDIKPANILMTAREVYDTERPRITDFGVAKLVGGDMTTTGQLLGTPAFMPPEQFTGAPIDHRTDLFALGVILYGMATGEPPFSGETLTAVSYKVVHTDPIPPAKLNPAIPPELEALILKCLAKNPAARYQTGEELAADLALLRSEALHPGAHGTVLRQIAASPGGSQETDGTEIAGNETINQIASLRPRNGAARTYVMPMRGGTAVATAPPVAGTATPAGTGRPKIVAAKPANKILLYGLAGIVVVAAAAAATVLLHHRAAATIQQAPAQPAAVAAPAAASVAPAPVTAPAAQPAVGAASAARTTKTAAHKPAAGTKAAAPAPVAVAAAAIPPPAAVPAPPTARPAPAAALAVSAVNFNPKTLDAATNTHLKLNLEGLSAPLTVTLQMDGKLYWSGPAGDKKGYQGLLVPPGNHQFRVLVKGQHTVKISNTVSGDFVARKHMSLSVKLRPESSGDSGVLDPSAQVSATLKKELFAF